MREPLEGRTVSRGRFRQPQVRHATNDNQPPENPEWFNRAIESYEKRKKQEALAAAEAAAKESGYTLSELLGTTAKGKGKVNPPKYRHPENPELTWTGRGRQPDWIKEGLQAGKSLEDFLIVK